MHITAATGLQKPYLKQQWKLLNNTLYTLLIIGSAAYIVLGISDVSFQSVLKSRFYSVVYTLRDDYKRTWLSYHKVLAGEMWGSLEGRGCLLGSDRIACLPSAYVARVVPLIQPYPISVFTWLWRLRPPIEKLTTYSCTGLNSAQFEFTRNHITVQP